MGGRPLALAVSMQALLVGAALAAPGDLVPPHDAPTGFATLAADAALVPSPAAERARLSAALAEELGASLRRLPGVKDARVHLLVAPPARGPLGGPDTHGQLGEPPAPAKAAVLLLLEAGTERVDEAGVRALVAGAAPGVTADAVTVVLSHEPAAVAAPAAGPRPNPERGPARLLRWALLALLASQLLLAALTIALLRRVRAVEALTRR